jgi:hypothetical protein
MIATILKNEESYKILQNTFTELKFSIEIWEFIKNFSAAFDPVYITTLKFQEEQLLLSE